MSTVGHQEKQKFGCALNAKHLGLIDMQVTIKVTKAILYCKYCPERWVILSDDSLAFSSYLIINQVKRAVHEETHEA